MSDVEAKINAKIKDNARESAKNFDKMADSVKNTSLNFNSLLASVKSTVSMVKQLTDWTDKSVTSMRLMNTVFGNGAKSIGNYSNKMAEMTGLNETILRNQVSLFGQLSQSLGLTGENMEALTKNVTTLSAKMAILYNQDYGTMATAVQRAIQGTQTTLNRATGLRITNAGMQSTLASIGINREVKSLNEAEKAIVKYLTLSRMMTAENERYADAVNDVAWQKQILTQQISRLAAALGGALYPILRNILPILNGILMTITEIISIVAGLTSDTSEITQNTIGASDAYDDLGNSISKASSNAKKSLRSFDKLNNITTPSGGGGSGTGTGIDSSLLKALSGAGNELLNIKNRATEIRDQLLDWLGFSKDVNGEWKWSADKVLKNMWNSWKKLNALGKAFVALGIAVALTKIVSGFSALAKTIAGNKLLNPLSSVTSLFKNMIKVTQDGKTSFMTMATGLERFQAGLAGIVGMTAGIMSIVSAIQKIKEEGLSLNSILELILGTVGLVGGAIVTVTAITGTFTTTMAVATGGISLIIGAVAGLVTWFATQSEKETETVGVIQQHINKLRELKDAQTNEIQVIESKVGRIQTLENELLNLVDSNGKVIGSQEEASRIVNSLNELLGTEYKLTDGQITLNGKAIKTYKDLKASIDNYCGALRTEAYLEIKREEYNERLSTQLDLNKKIEEKTKELENAQKNYDMTSEEGILKFISGNQDKISKLAELQSEYKTNEQELRNYEEAGYQASVGNYNKAQELLTQTFGKVSVTTKDLIDDIVNSSSQIPEEIKKNIDKTTKQISEASKATVQVNLDTSKVNSQLNSLKKSISSSTVTVNLSNVPKHAQGGFPEDGLFFANHNEMVGKFSNGKTAVANNQQITQGIATAVYKAIQASNLGGGTEINITAEGDASGLLQFIKFQQEKENRQFAN